MQSVQRELNFASDLLGVDDSFGCANKGDTGQRVTVGDWHMKTR